MTPNISGFQVIKCCIQYLASHPHKTIFYPYNSDDGSNSIKLTWSGDQFEGYTTRNCLEFHQDEDRAIIIKRRRLVSGIIFTLLGVSICWKLHIQLAVASDSTDG